jgi:tetratricopeptide (TPR) repeat protein
LEKAMALHKEEERICRELGDKAGLSGSLGNQALILKARGELDGAMALHKEVERICRELGDKAGLATSLANQAALLSDKLGFHEEALPLAEEAYRLATNHGLNALARQIKPILDFVRSKVEQASVNFGLASVAHPNADPERAARLNIHYQEELARWKALPWWKRLTVKKPEPPTGL